MVVSAIFSILQTVFGSVLSMLPTVTVTLPTIDASQLPMLGTWNGMIPIDEICSVLALLVTVVFPAILAYKVANWVWRHIPEVAGFGTGGG